MIDWNSLEINISAVLGETEVVSMAPRPKAPVTPLVQTDMPRHDIISRIDTMLAAVDSSAIRARKFVESGTVGCLLTHELNGNLPLVQQSQARVR